MYLPDVEKIYQGSDPVEKIMQGDEQVWPYIDTEPSYSGDTLMFKPNWKNASVLDRYTGNTFSLFSGNDGILFTDYSGNVMDAVNATVNREYDGSVGVRWNTVRYDADGWARFRFDRPLYGIYCGIGNQGSKMPFAVIPPTVRVLGGFYGLGADISLTYDKERRMRFYIPEGVQVLRGQCVYGAAIFRYGSVHIPSTVQTIGTAGIRSERDDNALYPANRNAPQLYYYNGTYDEYNAIDWQGRTAYSTDGGLMWAGYPVKCTDGVFYYPKSYGGL